MKSMFCAGAALAALAFAVPIRGQSIRIVKFSEGKPFQMGKVTSRRVVHPDLGAKRLTLNYSASENGSEFSQHVHDHSDDTILVLKGNADLRQGDTRHPIPAGTCAFVPAGQIHGTITTADGTIMISFQTPPDLILYTGARDSSRPGAAPPKGVITPGAVKFIPFGKVNGFFAYPGATGTRVAAARHELKPGQKFTTGIGKDGEQLLFVWSGEISVQGGGQDYVAGEKDTAFITGPNEVRVRGGPAGAVVIEVQAPPYKGW
jgi:quercetin dioxygenase-like cupin family protein